MIGKNINKPAIYEVVNNIGITNNHNNPVTAVIVRYDRGYCFYV